jgi:hypothetical protein|tara:strand:- start:285 stop:623 length:339 start_codon:yes stop_codon:yes gene_type:complete
MSIIPIELEDNYESEWSQHFDDARDECMTLTDDILMEVEDWVHPTEATVDIENVLALATAIERVKALRYYTYTVRVYGKYRDYDEDFDYDFTDAIRDSLQDRISCEILVGGK